MKTKQKLLTLAIILFAFYAKAQITGPITIQCGNQATYSISNLAQCSQCYDWDFSGDISIISSDMNNSVTIQADNNAGSGTLSVTYFNESGCHQMSPINISIQCIPTPTCCEPELNSYFICHGWDGGHGAVYIDFTGNNCDRNSVSSIDWVLNGAVFSSGSLNGQSSGTTYGAGSPGNISSGSPSYGIYVTATIHYNNGCSDVTLYEDVDTDSCNDDGEIGIHPNPTKSKLIINGYDNKLNDNVRIKIYDLNNGSEIFNKKLKYNKEINLKDFTSSKKVRVVIIDNNTIIKQSTIIIK